MSGEPRREGEWCPVERRECEVCGGSAHSEAKAGAREACWKRKHKVLGCSDTLFGRGSDQEWNQEAGRTKQAVVYWYH